MIKNLVVVFFAFFVFQCASAVPASGQIGPGCFAWVANGGVSGYGVVPPTGPVYDCSTEGPFLIECRENTSLCPPPAAASETCLACALARAGSPINLAGGNTYITEADIRIPGLGGGLSLVRTWNSLWPATQSAFQVGIFGPNWRSNYEERIFVGSDNYIKYARGDGSFWSFGLGGPGWELAAPGNVTASLVAGSSYWTITFQNGERRFFDNTSGNLIAIVDRNGNTTTLSYDSVGRLVTVTDPASRQLNFTYGGSSNLLVTSVSSSVGVSTSYSYDSQGRLIQVTEPDGSTLSFQYNSQSLISAVTDSNGVILESHTYDSSGRGLTSSRANGVDAVTVSYTN